MGFDYDRCALVRTISDAVTNHFLAMVPGQHSAADVRQVLREAIKVTAKATAVMAPQFEYDPAGVVREALADLEQHTDRILSLLLRPGSKAWTPPACTLLERP